jgi:uncharacterized RDD family membrane protein YckC
MEAEWMKQIPSETICSFFYAFYIVYAILFVLSLASTIGIIAFNKKLGAAGIAVGIQGILMTAFGAVITLFYYLICDRALLATKKTKQDYTV